MGRRRRHRGGRGEEEEEVSVMNQRSGEVSQLEEGGAGRPV